MAGNAGRVPSLRGVGIFETTTWTGIDGVSFAGGADAMFTASNLQMEPADNVVTLETSSLSGSSQTFQCPKLTTLDEFNSKTMNGKLYYRLPSLPDLIGGSVDYYSLKAVCTVATKAEIISGADVLYCKTTAYCTLTYRWSHTPVFYYLTNPIMFTGMEVSLILNPFAAPSRKATNELAADIRLDGFRFLTDDYTTDWNMGQNSLQDLRGTVRAKERTK